MVSQIFLLAVVLASLVHSFLNETGGIPTAGFEK